MILIKAYIIISISSSLTAMSFGLTNIFQNSLELYVFGQGGE